MKLSDELYLFNEGRNFQAYRLLGAHPDQAGTTFRVWAPNASQVSVIGDFNAWQGAAHCMHELGASGIWELRVPEAAKNFLRMVIENGRLSALPEMATQFRALKNAQSGSSDAIVHSAFPIDAAALADLGKTLEAQFKRKLNLSVVLQPELIGGIRVVVGDEVLDTSVKARLQQMKVALTA